MTSTRQIEANRRNAERSTGPKTARGKATSSQNALRHGLARVHEDDAQGLVSLTFALRCGLGQQVAPETLVAVARAKRDLLSARRVRQAMVIDIFECPAVETVKRLKKIERYERSALAAQKRALRSLKSEHG
ncbi:hypothetical protein [Bradyrhizobium brasilense]|uniref:Uncharacterized protein n=1 Tax=Bradyrhizobium brasilense TaxID=1419277 RepID=A0A1G7A3E6_9BRAD|nr:hypothetical protein [Bradyrhizobium brasilense]MCC8971767.1 hypothetical protein [Bradyrhizobium brasilense]SDE08416.1 hypothetical protein SAMN05216337_1019134 [Bradyrhizobium brasilense]